MRSSIIKDDKEHPKRAFFLCAILGAEQDVSDTDAILKAIDKGMESP
jgi:hypothetical protein